MKRVPDAKEGGNYENTLYCNVTDSNKLYDYLSKPIQYVLLFYFNYISLFVFLFSLISLYINLLYYIVYHQEDTEMNVGAQLNHKR